MCVAARFNACNNLLLRGFSLYSTSDAAAKAIFSPRSVVCNVRRAMISPCFSGAREQNIKMCTEYTGRKRTRSTTIATTIRLNNVSQGKFEMGDRRVPYNNPRDALHLGVIQVLMYRVQLYRAEKKKERKRRPDERENNPKSVIKFSLSNQATAYQIPRAANTFVEHMDTLSYFKIGPASLVQRVQASLFPEDSRHVKDIAPQYDVAAQLKKLSSEPHRVAPRKSQSTRTRERAWQSLRPRMFKNCICLRFIMC